MSGVLVYKILQIKQEQIPFVIFFSSIFLQKYFLFEITREVINFYSRLFMKLTDWMT